jgi:hypothetical protein
VGKTTEPFCARLASNDPDLKAVDCDVVCLSQASTENSLRIGKAIQGNTVVSSLTLIPSESNSEVHTLLQQFIRNSSSLSTCMFMPKRSGIDDGAEAGVMEAYLDFSALLWSGSAVSRFCFAPWFHENRQAVIS